MFMLPEEGIDQLNTQKSEYALCKFYHSDQSLKFFVGKMVPIVIIVINIILKTLIIKLIIWVGEVTQSLQLTSITNGVFVAQFMNTGIILLLVNANLTEHQPSFITKHVRGRYFDYESDWYGDVG